MDKRIRRPQNSTRVIEATPSLSDDQQVVLNAYEHLTPTARKEEFKKRGIDEKKIVAELVAMNILDRRGTSITVNHRS